MEKLLKQLKTTDYKPEKVPCGIKNKGIMASGGKCLCDCKCDCGFCPCSGNCPK